MIEAERLVVQPSTAGADDGDGAQHPPPRRARGARGAPSRLPQATAAQATSGTTPTRGEGPGSSTWRRHSFAFRRRPAPTTTSATGRPTRSPTRQAPGNRGGSEDPEGGGREHQAFDAIRDPPGEHGTDEATHRVPVDDHALEPERRREVIDEPPRLEDAASATVPWTAPARPRKIGATTNPVVAEWADHIHPRPGARAHRVDQQVGRTQTIGACPQVVDAPWLADIHDFAGDACPPGDRRPQSYLGRCASSNQHMGASALPSGDHRAPRNPAPTYRWAARPPRQPARQPGSAGPGSEHRSHQAGPPGDRRAYKLR